MKGGIASINNYYHISASISIMTNLLVLNQNEAWDDVLCVN
jgi:hypothetical protein